MVIINFDLWMPKVNTLEFLLLPIGFVSKYLGFRYLNYLLVRNLSDEWDCALFGENGNEDGIMKGRSKKKEESVYGYGIKKFQVILNRFIMVHAL